MKRHRTHAKMILRTVKIVLLLSIAAAVMTLGTMEAQTVNWVEVASGSPSARVGMGMAYDLATKSTVLFGGANSGTTYGDTWNWRGNGCSYPPPLRPPHATAQEWRMTRRQATLYFLEARAA